MGYKNMFYNISGNKIKEHFINNKKGKKGGPKWKTGNIKAPLGSFNTKEFGKNIKSKLKLKNYIKSKISGDCQNNYEAPFNRDITKTAGDCAEKCDENVNCKRFTFGKKTLDGKDG